MNQTTARRFNAEESTLWQEGPRQRREPIPHPWSQTAAPLRRRPALPSGYEPPDYRVVPVRLADGRVLHVNADDLADPRYKNVRNLNPDGTPVKGRAALQARAVFDGAQMLAPPAYGSAYRLPLREDYSSRPHPGVPRDPHVPAGTSSAVDQLLQQAEHAGIRLTPGMAEGVELGDPKVIAYVADLITQLGGRPAVEPRYQGGTLVPGQTYTVNERGPESVVDMDGQIKPLGNGQPAVVQAQWPGVVLPVGPAPAAQTHAPNPNYSTQPTQELQKGMEVMSQINAYNDAKNRAAAERPAGWEKIKTSAGNAITGAGHLVKDTAVGLGKTAATAITVAAEPLNPYAWAEGLPLTRAAGDAALTGLTSMGASTNHFLGRFTPAGKNLQSHLDQVRAELDKSAPGDSSIDFRPWLKAQDKILQQQHLPAWYAGVRPLDDGTPTADDIRLAGVRGLTNPENSALILEYRKTRDPKIWAQLERNIMLTPEGMAAEQMRQEVMQSDGGQKLDRYFGKGFSENLLSTYHPVSLATTVVPLAKGFTAAKEVIKAAPKEIGRTIARNVVRSVPEGAGYGALQQIEADPQSSGADILKGAAKNALVNGGATGAGALVGVGAKKALGTGEVPEAFRNLPPPPPRGDVLYAYTREPQWNGDVMKARSLAARQWASEHPPGPWAYGNTADDVAKRIAITGKAAPIKDFAVISGPAREKFVPAKGMGPFRNLKRAAGQYHTEQAGELNLKTGEFSKPSWKQKTAKGLSDAAGRVLDPAMWPLGVTAVEAAREHKYGGPTPVLDGMQVGLDGVLKGYDGIKNGVDYAWENVSNLWNPKLSKGSGTKTPPQR